MHLIDRYIDFSFIREKTRPYYSADNGRPSIDPVVLFMMVFIGYLYGIRSERQLEQEVKTNVAYRWFLGLKLTDKVEPNPRSKSYRPDGYIKEQYRLRDEARWSQGLTYRYNKLWVC